MDVYDRCRILGTGTFGAAWLVQSRVDASDYVCKEIPLSSMVTTKERVAAVTEFKILSTLHHKNIVCYKDAFVRDQMLCIIMEYADDGDLSEKIRAQCGRLFLELYIIDWFVQILVAVKYIHSLNILHRDIKAQNILLTKSGLIKVGDFGISCFGGNTDDGSVNAGTPFYMAPEVCKNTRALVYREVTGGTSRVHVYWRFILEEDCLALLLDIRGRGGNISRGSMHSQKSDMWSLGVLLYQLCTLEYPFSAEDISALHSNIKLGQYVPISNCYSALLKDLVEVLLRVEPEKRPSSAQLLKAPSLHHHLKSYLMKVKDGPVLFRCQAEKDDTPTSIGRSSRSTSGKGSSVDSLDSATRISRENNVDHEHGGKVVDMSVSKKLSNTFNKMNRDSVLCGEDGKDSTLECGSKNKSFRKSSDSGNSNTSGDETKSMEKTSSKQAKTPKRSKPMQIDFIERNKILATSPPERFINPMLTSPRTRPSRDELFSPARPRGMSRQAKSAPEVLVVSKNDDQLAEKSVAHLRSKSGGTKNLSHTKSPSTKIPSLSKQLKRRSIPRPVDSSINDRSHLISDTDSVSEGRPKLSRRISSDKFSFYNLRKRARSPAIGNNAIEKKIAKVARNSTFKKKSSSMAPEQGKTPKTSEKEPKILKIIKDGNPRKSEKKPMVICNEEIVMESESDVITNHLAVHSSANKENEVPSGSHNRTFTLSPEEVGSSQNKTRVLEQREIGQKQQQRPLKQQQHQPQQQSKGRRYTSTPLQNSTFRLLQQPLHSTLRGNETGVSYRSDGVTPLPRSVVNPYVSARSSNCTCNLNYDTTSSRDLSVVRSKMEGRIGADVLDTALHCLRKVDLSDDDFDNLWKLCQVLKLDECLFFGVLEIAQAEK